MVMIAHQHTGMDPPPCARAGLAEGFQKAPPVLIVLENRLAPVSAVENVINGSLLFNACFAGHCFARFLSNRPPPARADFQS